MERVYKKRMNVQLKYVIMNLTTLNFAGRKYEESVCKSTDCDNTTYKTKYCSRKYANQNSWKQRNNPVKRPKVRKKISEKQKGKNNNFYGKKHSKEAKKKISESLSGEKHHLYGVTGEDHPSYGIVPGLKFQKVNETGHTVRSNWEKEIDLILHKNNICYEYEPKTFQLSNGGTYTPDFIVQGQIVIEVKGWPNKLSKKRAKQFMSDYSEYVYVVVGNRIPYDKFIKREEKEKLISLLREIKK